MCELAYKNLSLVFMALCMFIRTLVQSGICISPNVASTICSAHCVRTCAFYLFCLLWSCHDILMECTHSAMCYRCATVLYHVNPCGSRRLSFMVYAVSHYHTPSLVGHKPASWHYRNLVASSRYHQFNHIDIIAGIQIFIYLSAAIWLSQ